MKICEVLVKQNKDLQVLLAVEDNGLGLDLPVLDVDLVAGEDDGNVLTDADEVTVPVGNVLVGDTRGHIKHDDGALTLSSWTIEYGLEYVHQNSPGCSSHPSDLRTSPGRPYPRR